jgi:AcrR family transcriptional regulator
MGRISLVDVRQEEITLAFYEVAKEVGLENATIARVAKKMDISKGLVMYYFKTKESLIFTLNDYILERYLHFVVVEKKNAIFDKHSLINFIGTLFSREWNLYVDDGVFYSFYAMIYQNDKIKENYKVFLETIRDEIEKILTNCFQKGIIKNNNIQNTANILYTLIDGAYFQMGAKSYDKNSYETESAILIEHVKTLLIFSDN